MYPPNTILDIAPGEIFVHRNVANLVPENDSNSGAVLQYAVEVLKVERIIVCGHYHCGGVQAALPGNGTGHISRWLQDLKDLYRNHAHKIDQRDSDEERENLLAELNVREQVKRIARSEIVRKSWESSDRPILQGLIYDLRGAMLRKVVGHEPRRE